MGKGLLERLGLARKPALTLKEFRERVIEGMLQRKPDLSIDRAGDAEILYGDGGQTHVGRGYAYYREHPKELEHVLCQLADHVVREPHVAAAEELMVVVRAQAPSGPEKRTVPTGAWPFHCRAG